MDWYNALSTVEKFFAVCSAVGGSLFLLRMALMLLGGDHGDLDHGSLDAAGADVDVDSDVPHDVGHDGHIGDSDASFQLLSINTATAFIMMFGLVGLSLMRAGVVGAAWAVVCGLVGGFLTMLLAAKLFSIMLKLQSSGTLDINHALGAEGTVYLTIPAEGTGKVQVVVQERLREFEAISEDKVELKTGERIRVSWIVRGNVLSVKKVD